MSDIFCVFVTVRSHFHEFDFSLQMFGVSLVCAVKFTGYLRRFKKDWQQKPKVKLNMVLGVTLTKLAPQSFQIILIQIGQFEVWSFCFSFWSILCLLEVAEKSPFGSLPCIHSRDTTWKDILFFVFFHRCLCNLNNFCLCLPLCFCLCLCLCLTKAHLGHSLVSDQRDTTWKDILLFEEEKTLYLSFSLSLPLPLPLSLSLCLSLYLSFLYYKNHNCM